MPIMETSHCPSCLKDKIYVLEDGDGICTICKSIVHGPIHGGIGYHEFLRLRGELPGSDAEPAPDAVKAHEKHEELASIIEALGGTVKSAKTSAKEPVQVQVKPEKKAPEGPGVFSRILKGTAKTIGETIAEMKNGFREHSVAPVPKGNVLAPSRNDIPRPGERWSVGPCISCFGLHGRMLSQIGVVISEEEYRKFTTGTKTKAFVYIKSSTGFVFHGCMLCARKA